MLFAPWLLRDAGAGEGADPTALLLSPYFQQREGGLRFHTGQCRGTAVGLRWGLHAQTLLLQCCRWEPTNQLPRSTGRLRQRKGRAACSLPAETKPFYCRDKRPTCSQAWGLSHSLSPSCGSTHHMRARHSQGRNGSHGRLSCTRAVSWASSPLGCN